jgi:nucleotide-binding universal stress UspA family protein
MAGWKKLCCAIDFSETSHAAMCEATELARRFGAELELLHVHPLPPAAGVDDMSVRPPDFVEVASTELEGRMASWQEEAERAAGRAVHSTVLPGPAAAAADEILRFLHEHGHDLLVVGTHGRRGVQRLLLGSVAERVVREAPCSVLVIRGGAAGAG